MRRSLYVIGSPELYAGTVELYQIETPSEAASAPDGALPVLPLPGVPKILPGQPNGAAAPAIVAAIELATQHALAGDAAGIVTNPINKALLYGAGFTHPGHTEFIAQICGKSIKPVMMLVGGGLRVALATIHQSLRSVPDSLSTEGLIEIGSIAAAALKRDFGLKAPKIAFSGLNPHAGENGALGQEEIEIINPAANALRRAGIDISNARPGDTVFAESLAGQFDAVIAMTHDQGLIPVKTLDFWGGVNVTLGLPIVRTSPDHGTAYEAAANGTARPDSLIAAILLADKISKNRAAHD
ncbi:UNVERIFIED_CONTAM: hypothetical protein GTU68_044915 [Idotea baltica]|nr:hypothetical protein [Idotea baltica]